MMRKMMVLGAGAVGYVLGARAGRERYEQIARQARKLRNNPTVQQKVSEARHMATDTAKDAAGTAAEKIRNRGDSSGESPSMSYSTQVPGSASGGYGRGDTGV